MKLRPSPVRGTAARTRKPAPTLVPGTINRRNQQLIGATGMPSTTKTGQAIYRMKCLEGGQGQPCGFEYGSNGTDAFLRTCPRCQGGAPGEPLPDRSHLQLLF